MSTEPESVSGEVSISGGVLRATVTAGESLNTIGTVSFSGNFKQEPDGILFGLEQLLAGTLIDQAPAKIEEFFKENPTATPSVPVGEYLTALTLAFMKIRVKASKAPDPEAWKKGEL